MMTVLTGHKVSMLPFEGLIRMEDIIYLDGPILTHYLDGNGRDILFYWVDFSESVNRWLVFNIENNELFNYLSGGISLQSLIKEIVTPFVFLVDLDEMGNYSNCIILDSFNIPANYIPGDDSFYTTGMPIVYDRYLSDNMYISRLREKSFVFNLRPTDDAHETTVSAKDGGEFLTKISSSIENYIDYRANEDLKDRIGDRKKLNKTINQLKQRITPRIAEAKFNSFEVALAIDNITLIEATSEIKELTNEIIVGYKNDVLDVNYSDEDEVKLILERIPDQDSRKRIYEPFFKILNNNTLNLKVSTFNRSFEKDYSTSRPNESFRSRVLPKPNVEEFLAEQQQRSQLITAVFKVPEGGSLSDLKKKDIIENLLFTQDSFQTRIPIVSPIIVDDNELHLKSELECILSIDKNGMFTLYNLVLDLHSESPLFEEAMRDIKAQLIKKVEFYKSNPDMVDNITKELDNLIS